MISRADLPVFFFAFAAFPILGNAVAPVVDDGENIALLEERAEKPVSPFSKDRHALKYGELNEEVAIAHDDSSNNPENFASKVHELERELQELRGQLEIQGHELQLMKEKQAQLPPSSTSNLQVAHQEVLLKEKPETNVNVELSKPQPKNPADEQIAYLAAYELVKNRRFDDALSAMETFVSEYPRGGYTSNAEYWLGELYLVKRNYNEAIRHFEVILKSFPTSSKAAPSSLKIGYALAASGNKKAAEQRLMDVIERFPDTPSAKLAETKLHSLRSL